MRLLLVAAVLALDQLTKAIVRSSIPLGDSRRVIGGVLDITNVHNKGVAFGVLAGGGAIVAALTGVALGAIVVYFVMRSRTAYLWLPVGMLLGGALGNLLDRAREGAVTDFIDPILWPAFNVADSCIVLGVLGLLWVIESAASETHERLMEQIAFVAAAEDADARLDVRLAAEAAVGSRAKAQRLIDSGLVTVDGRARPKRHRLSPGERVEARIEAPAAPDDPAAGEGVPYEVVFEDDYLLVVDKPAGVVVHPAAGHATGHALPGARGARRSGRGSAAPRHRPPPGPRHLRAAGGGQVGRGPPRPPGADPPARAGARVPGARGGPARG